MKTLTLILVLFIAFGCKKEPTISDDDCILFIHKQKSLSNGYKFNYVSVGSVGLDPLTGKYDRDTVGVYSNSDFKLNTFYYLPLSKHDSIVNSYK